MRTLRYLAPLAMVGLASGAMAADTVKLPMVVELSGAGAVSGTNYRDGA